MNITRWLGVTVLSVLFTKTGISQQLRLGSNPSANVKSAVLELQSNNQGLLFSRISDTALINLMNPPDGMVIYFTPMQRLLLRANGYWQSLTPAAALNSFWSVDGNSNGAVKKLGTIDNFALPFITNNTERMRITNAGRVGIGTNAPDNILEVTGTNTSTGVSGLRLTDLGTATVATANTKLLSVNSSGDVIVTNNLAANNWLFTGNSGINPAVNFLGTTDDKQMILKSNNQSYLEFGRRQTLGLTQGYTDYTDNDEKVTYVRSALQFEANGADFYKPKMWTDANGNFRMKGSSAGTDYFEFGSTGTANNGGFEFVIGDDGDEPIVFKSYNYTTGMSEMMRLQSGRMAVGSSTFDAVSPEKLLIDAGTTTSYNLMTGKGTIDNYLQINVQNKSAGGNASSDIVATANNGSETTNYIDMGINGSGFGNNVYPILNGGNTAYLYSTANDMVMGNGTSGKNLRFFTGGFNLANERMRIDGNGLVGIGTLAPNTTLHIKSGVANDAGLRLENLTSSSTTTSGAAVLGVDATGKVVRAKAPVFYSGTGTTATVDGITKVWVAEVSNVNGGVQTVAIPSNVAFSSVLNIQVTAKGGSNVTSSPIALVVSNTTTAVTIRVVESATSIFVIEGLEVHNDTNTKIYIRIEGN